MNEMEMLMLVTGLGGLSAGLMIAIFVLLGSRERAPQPPVIVMPPTPESDGLGCGGVLVALVMFMIGLALFFLVMNIIH